MILYTFTMMFFHQIRILIETLSGTGKGKEKSFQKLSAIADVSRLKLKQFIIGWNISYKSFKDVIRSLSNENMQLRRNPNRINQNPIKIHHITNQSCNLQECLYKSFAELAANCFWSALKTHWRKDDWWRISKLLSDKVAFECDNISRRVQHSTF